MSMQRPWIQPWVALVFCVIATVAAKFPPVAAAIEANERPPESELLQAFRASLPGTLEAFVKVPAANNKPPQYRAVLYRLEPDLSLSLVPVPHTDPSRCAQTLGRFTNRERPEELFVSGQKSYFISYGFSERLEVFNKTYRALELTLCLRKGSIQFTLQRLAKDQSLEDPTPIKPDELRKLQKRMIRIAKGLSVDALDEVFDESTKREAQ